MSRRKDQDKPEETTQQKIISTVAWLVGTVILVLGIQHFLVKPFQIPSGSMEQTLQIGDRVMVGRLGFVWKTPQRGQIIVFHPPAGAPGPNNPATQCGGPGGTGSSQICSKPLGGPADQYFIKRIVALGGDRVALRSGVLWVNNKPLREPYALPCQNTEMCNFPKPITIPQGSVLALGDNRDNSDDGRFWGPIKHEWIVGPVVARWWPLNRLTLGSP